jgi:hypothetical protein
MDLNKLLEQRLEADAVYRSVSSTRGAWLSVGNHMVVE